MIFQGGDIFNQGSGNQLADTIASITNTATGAINSIYDTVTGQGQNTPRPYPGNTGMRPVSFDYSFIVGIALLFFVLYGAKKFFKL